MICIGSLLVSQEKYADMWKPIFQATGSDPKLQKQVLSASFWGGKKHKRFHSSGNSNDTVSRIIDVLKQIDVASLHFAIRNASTMLGCHNH